MGRFPGVCGLCLAGTGGDDINGGEPAYLSPSRLRDRKKYYMIVVESSRGEVALVGLRNSDVCKDRW